MMRWTPEQMDRLETAARRGLRVTLLRRGTEYVVTARKVTSRGQKEVFVGFLPMTGEELAFTIDEIDHFEVIGL
jgi:transcriptional antiterminator Rof (Rho-off)